MDNSTINDGLLRQMRKSTVTHFDPSLTGSQLRDAQLRKLRAMPEALSKVVQDRATKIASVKAEAMFSPEYKDELIAAAHEQAKKDFDRLREQYQTYSTELKEHAAKVRQGSKPDTNEEILRLLQRQETWQRVKPLLDNESESWLSLINKAVTSGDRATIETLQVNMPTYLAPKITDTNSAAQVIKGFENYAEKAIQPLLPTSQRQGSEILSEFADGLPNLEMAFSNISTTLSTPNATYTAIPGWERGSVVIVPTDA